MVKLVNGEPHGMFILTAEPKELTIVLILGPIRMDQLGELNGIAGLGALGDVGRRTQDGKDKDKPRQGEEGRRRMKRLWLIPIVSVSLLDSGGVVLASQRRQAGLTAW